MVDDVRKLALYAVNPLPISDFSLQKFMHCADAPLQASDRIHGHRLDIVSIEALVELLLGAKLVVLLHKTKLAGENFMLPVLNHDGGISKLLLKLQVLMLEHIDALI